MSLKKISHTFHIEYAVTALFGTVGFPQRSMYSMICHNLACLFRDISSESVRLLMYHLKRLIAKDILANKYTSS